MRIYLDGQFVDDSDARLSVFDAAVQHAVGLFETMVARNGHIFQLEAHVERLVASASELGLASTLRPGPLAEAVELTLAENDRQDARIRLTVTGGDLALLPGRGGEGEHHPSVLITATDPTDYPEAFFTRGVRVVIADPKANPFDPGAGHKTVNYWARLQSLAAAAAAEAGEALWFSVTNHLCGGAVSNAFLVKDGQLHTPLARGEEPEGALRAPVLPGITRAVVQAIASDLGTPVERRLLSIDDVLGADEVFLTNSSWGILPVVAVEKQAVGGGEPGEVTGELRQALNERIEGECGG